MLTRHIKHSLTTIAVILCSLTASAHDFEVGGIFYNITSSANKTVEVTYKGSYSSEYVEYMGDMAIPSTVIYNGLSYNVTSIGEYAFYGSYKLNSITIPEGITSIKKGAFESCNRLSHITIPESVTTIGDEAFFRSGLTSITIPKSVLNIGRAISKGCNNLTTIVVADGNKKYDSRNGCNAIIETSTNTLIAGCAFTIIPENLEKIGDGVFYECYGLKEVSLPTCLKAIGYTAFYCCTSLTSITIPEGVKDIKSLTFGSCTSLTDIVIPKSITKIGDSAFSGCRSLTTIIIPESVRSIESNAFGNCSSLTSITIPEGITKIENVTFHDCSNLTTVILPTSVIDIGSRAFASCNNLQNLYCHAGKVPTTNSNAFDSSNLANATLHVPTNLLSSYKNRAPWSNFGNFAAMKVAVSNITLNRSSANLTEGGTLTLTATVTPSNADNTSVSWSSSNTGVATVDSKGKVTGKAAGTATITVTANDGSGVKASCVVTVKRKVILVSNITLNQSTATLTEGGTLTLTATVTPSNADNSSLSWSSSNSSVATVDSKGKVTAKAAGTATITATANDGSGVKASCVVTVKRKVILVSNITLNQSTATLTEGGTLALTATVTPSNADNTSVSWSSSNTSVATVDANGKVTAKTPGTATITATANDGSGVKASCVLTVTAAKFGSCGSNLTWILTDDGELIIEGSGAMTDYAETTDAPWSLHKNLIKKVTIHKGVTSIGAWSFYECSNLTAITIPEELTSIGDCAFFACSSLTAVNIPKEVTSIGRNAFRCCHNLTTINLPEGVTNIEEAAFSYCLQLTAINIPESVTSIGDYVFDNCESLTAITIPEGVTSIGKSAFNDCESLTSITIPESVSSIGEDAFLGCSSLTAVHISSIEAWCKISFEDDGSNPLYYANNLYLNGELVTELVIPEGVTSIGDYAFNYYRKLTTINLPKGLNSIGDRAFKSCYELTNITIPEGVTRIGDYAFAYCSGLSSFVMPTSVTSIGEYAFGRCSGLETITIPEGVTSIEDGTFSECNLTSIIFAENSQIERIGYHAFAYCDFTSINLPKGVKSIGDWAFVSCHNLTSVVLPASLQSIGQKAFSYCEKLHDVYCYAERVPSTVLDAFDNSYCKNATLYVPANAIASYRNTAPWSSFGTFKTNTLVTGVALKQTSATLIEGEALTLTATVTPNDATDSSLTWSSSNLNVATVDTMGVVRAVAPGTATITATANDGSGVSSSCEVTVLAYYNIIFMVDGEVYHIDSLVQGSSISLPDEPIKEGYTFTGWRDVPEAMPAGDVTISGAFIVNDYAVTFVVDGVVVDSDSIAYGSVIPLPDEPIKEGYTFTGWSDVPETMPAGDVTISGAFIVNDYAVTFVVDGVVVDSDSIAYGSVIPLPDEPIKEGYTFTGWSDVPETMPAGDVTISGAFIVNDYAVTFVVDGVVVDSDSIAYGSVIPLPDEPIKEGYTFTGWSDVPETMPAGDVTIEASFSLNVYKINYFVGPKLVHVAEIPFGEAIPEYIYEPLDEGCIFLGWVGEIYDTMPAYNVGYTAEIENSKMERITDFVWLESNNTVELVVGESYKLEYSCSDKSLPFTCGYSSSWVYYDFMGGQHVVDYPIGYSIDERGVVKGLAPGSYAIRFTGWIQAQSGVDRWLYINVVPERIETESNNTIEKANDIYSKIRFSLQNASDKDWFKYSDKRLRPGDNVTFKLHYYGSNETPFGYKWSAYCGNDMVSGGSLTQQDQECRAIVASNNTVYLEIYYDQSRTPYFNNDEDFVAEVYVNGVPACDYFIDVERITLNKQIAELIVGDELKLIATISPDNATDKSVSWISSNSDIVSVNSNGEVFAKSHGTATITAVTKDGSDLSATCVVTVSPAISGICGSHLTWRIIDKEDLIIEGAGSMTDYTNEAEVPWNIFANTIKQVVVGKGVTTIGDFAFSGCTNLISIDIPESLRSLGSCALQGCINLTSISLPESVERIGESAFSGCLGLVEIFSYAKIIPMTASNVFEYVDVEKVTLYVPGVALHNYKTTTPWSRFGMIKGMDMEKTEIDGIWYILLLKENEAEVISSNVAYAGEVTIPSIVIHEGASYRVTGIGNSAFSACTDLTSITLPESVERIGDDAFLACYRLTAINIPQSVSLIGKRAFYSCIGLNSVTLPNSVQQIDESAFEGCSNLITIVLPNSLTHVGRNAFAYCDRLLRVYCFAESVPAAAADAFEESNLSNATLCVPSKALDAYKTTAPWSEFGNIVTLETGIENSDFINNNSEFIYDLTGRRLRSEYMETLPKGIYIIGGKKIVKL